jgi:heat shock protein HslJ
MAALGCVSRPAPEPDSSGATSREPPAPSASLGDATWTLVELDGAPALAARDANSAMENPHLRFEPDSGRVTGSTGCNHLAGRYELSGARLRLSQLISTKRACVEDARMRQETRFLAALEAADRHRLAGDTLALYAGERPRARFVRAHPN